MSRSRNAISMILLIIGSPFFFGFRQNDLQPTEILLGEHGRDSLKHLKSLSFDPSAIIPAAINVYQAEF